MSYPIQTIGDMNLATVRELPVTTKVAIAGVVAGALLYMSPSFRAWEKSLSSAQKVGLALGGAGIFLAIMQIAMTKQRDRQMISFQRGDGPVQPPPPMPDEVTT